MSHPSSPLVRSNSRRSRRLPSSMARIALLLACAGSTLALTPSELATRAQFEQWKLDYGKGYATSDEEASRFALFTEVVSRFGTGALSPYTDLTSDEHRAIFPPRDADDPALRWGLGDDVNECVAPFALLSGVNHRAGGERKCARAQRI